MILTGGIDMIYSMPINDIINTEARFNVNYYVEYNYIEVYTENTGSTDYLQISDNVYIIIDEFSNSIIGAKIMNFRTTFSLNELKKVDYLNLKNLLEQVCTEYGIRAF